MIKLPFDSCNIPLQRSLRTFDLDNLISNEGVINSVERLDIKKIQRRGREEREKNSAVVVLYCWQAVREGEGCVRRDGRAGFRWKRE